MKRNLNIIGVFKVMDDFNIKPNYSELERLYGIDRHTLKKYHDAGKIPERKKCTHPSKWDPYLESIISLMDLPGVTKAGVYNSLKYKYLELPGNYNSFRSYTTRKGIVCAPNDPTPHVLYETEIGIQLQCDWKESLKTHSIDGTLYEYNVFSATLGYSREHVFIYSIGKTEDDFIRCVIEVFRRLGGKTKILKTDNMSAIVSIKNGKRTVHKKIQAFFKDIDVKLELCDIRTPESKGKDESANRFLNWIKAYDYQIHDEVELIHIIEDHITAEANNRVNSRTHTPPAILFKKEKEYLCPIGNEMNLENYVQKRKRIKVPNTLLINFESKQYSVPCKYIGKYVDVLPIGNEIYIYHNSALITVHTVTENVINYKNEHYTEALRSRLKSDSDDIEELARKNLKRLNQLGGD